MLASDGPSFNLWADPAGHVGSGSGDAIDDSDNFSISTDMFYDILNEGQGQDAPPGMEDKIPNRYSNQFDIPVFSEIPSNFQDGIYQQQPWPFTSEIGQPGFDDIGRCENVYIESVNEDTPQDERQATCEKPSNFFEPFDYYVSPDHLFTDQICEGGVMGIPQQEDSKPVITDDVYQKSNWLSLSCLDQDKYARLKMKPCDFHGTSDTVDNHLFSRSLGCAGSSNFDVEDIELVSDSGCLVDLTHSDSDDDVMVKCMKTGYGMAGRSAGNFNSTSISASTSEYKKVFPKEALGEFSNTEKVSFKIGQKAIADDKPFVRETSRLSFETKAPANRSNSSPGSSSHMEDNTDIYIVEEASDLRHPTTITSMQKDIYATSQPPVFGDSLHLVGMGEQRVRTHDERVTYRLALQVIEITN